MKVKDLGQSQAFSCQNIIGVLGEGLSVEWNGVKEQVYDVKVKQSTSYSVGEVRN